MKKAGKNTNDNNTRESVEYYLDDEEVCMSRDPEQYGGIYRELAELLGDAAVAKIWKHYRGLTVTFPMRLHSRDQIHQFIESNMKVMKPAEIGKAVGLSERRVRQIIHDIRNKKKQKRDSK